MLIGQITVVFQIFHVRRKTIVRDPSKSSYAIGLRDFVIVLGLQEIEIFDNLTRVLTVNGDSIL